LEIRIKRISQYDINKNRKDLDEVAAAIRATRAKLKDLVGTTIAWLEALHAKYAKLFPRRTRVRSMEEIDKKAVANANLTIGYDPETGFIGTAVKGETTLKVSEYDRILIIMQNGMYKIIAPVEKTLVEGKLVRMQIFDQEKGFAFTLLYRDGDKMPWAKRSTITGFVKDREYELIKDRDGRIDHILPFDAKDVATSQYVPQKGARVHEAAFDLATLEPCGLGARGSRIGDKATAKITIAAPPAG
jgi:topoisomerase-4 subunit A